MRPKDSGSKSIAQQKAEWRLRMREESRRWQTQSQKLLSLEKKLQGQLSQFLKRQKGVGTVAGYVALAHEPRIEGLEPELRWVYPVVPGAAENGQSLLWYKPGPQGFAKAKWATEPVLEGATSVAAQELNVVLVPGLGFTEQGYRLGMGRGFYDRTLSEVTTDLVVGVAFSYQVLSESFWPREVWDKPVHWIVTEEGVLDCRALREGKKV
jgi:5-formyltetrahydrofolate cyclo-ligase